MLLGILLTTAVGIAAGLVEWKPQSYSLIDLSATALKLDVRGTLRLGFFEIIFVFLFIDMFDNIGTLVAVGKRAGLFNHANAIPRVDRILYADASATIVGALTGTSTVVSYIESAAGVAAGGRSGVTAMVTGAMFLVALFVAPVIGAIPAAATAPALIVVGSLMMTAMGEVNWKDPEVSIPSFLTMLAIPLTYSIANGLAFGFIAYTLLKIARGKFREVNWLVYALTLLFIARFVYLKGGLRWPVCARLADPFPQIRILARTWPARPPHRRSLSLAIPHQIQQIIDGVFAAQQSDGQQQGAAERAIAGLLERLTQHRKAFSSRESPSARAAASATASSRRSRNCATKSTDFAGSARSSAAKHSPRTSGSSPLSAFRRKQQRVARQARGRDSAHGADARVSLAVKQQRHNLLQRLRDNRSAPNPWRSARALRRRYPPGGPVGFHLDMPQAAQKNGGQSSIPFCTRL